MQGGTAHERPEGAAKVAQQCRRVKRGSMGAVSITRKDVQHVAALARLNLSVAEQERFTRELAKVLEFVSQLGEVDTADTPETAQVTGRTNVLRPDTPRPGLEREDFLRGAPAREDGELKVPGVFS